MIIGSGLLAHAFSHAYLQSKSVCIYAAGVSDSRCVDPREFSRERQRLGEALREVKDANVFVYFGTCSVADSEALNTPYVQHKLAMEQMVAMHREYLILRLPQVAGKTPNPHTLLNFLYARISRSERFKLWRKAKRNVIDVVDVVAIAEQFIANDSSWNATINIANVENYSMLDIVGTLESTIGKRAIFDIEERGAEYAIDVHPILHVLEKSGVQFGNTYLDTVVKKYYAPHQYAT